MISTSAIKLWLLPMEAVNEKAVTKKILVYIWGFGNAIYLAGL